MAYRAEKNGEDIDIVIDGFEKGIADDPYTGIGDMRGVNPLSVPKEASVMFATGAVSIPPVVTTAAFTCTAATDIITVANTTNYYAGMAVIINTRSGAIGLSVTSGSNTYYVNNITATTFKLYSDLQCFVVVDILLDGSGTFSTAQLATPFAATLGFNTSGFAIDSGTGQVYQDNYFVDSLGQAWIIGNGQYGYALNTLQFLGNTNRTSLTTSGSLGIAVFKNYLMVFIESKIDYIAISNIHDSSGPNGDWVIGWKTITSSAQGHMALSATDDALYFCNGSAVGSILQNAGSTFNPATSSTYTFNATALGLPSYDYAHCLAQLGTLLLVGGIQNNVYPWDRISTSFNYPLIVAESYISRIVSSNANAYIFAGVRGRIYITNGANVQIFKKFPDQIASTENPYYRWGDALYFRNQLYFGISGRTNGNTAINNFAGMWAIDLDTEVLYMASPLSYNTYTGTVPVLIPMGVPNALGLAVYIGWLNTTGGFDYSAGTPYTNYQSYIDTDIIPVGTYYDVSTDMQIEYKLSKPLVSGEGVKIYWRGNLTDSFTQVTSVTSVTGAISGAGQVNFQKQQWVQLRVALSSTASSPSYTKLREIRMR